MTADRPTRDGDRCSCGAQPDPGVCDGDPGCPWPENRTHCRCIHPPAAAAARPAGQEEDAKTPPAQEGGSATKHQHPADGACSQSSVPSSPSSPVPEDVRGLETLLLDLYEPLYRAIQEASWARGIAMLDSDVAVFRTRVIGALRSALDPSHPSPKETGR